jgi:hypothetical protein
MNNSANPDGSEPVPYSALMNEGNPGPQFQVEAGKVRYILCSLYGELVSQDFANITEDIFA